MFRQEFELNAYNAATDFNNLPSNSLIGKMSLMLDNSQGYEFKVIIDDLRGQSKGSTRDCRNNKYSLYDYIKKFDEVNIVRNIYNDPLKKIILG